MDKKSEFWELVSDFVSSMGETLELQENGCAIMVDGEVLVNIQYLDDSDTVLLWSSVGILPEDELCAERARYLLEKNDFWQESCGFTLGLDVAERRVLCHDVQAVETINSQDVLAAWIETLVEVTQSIRQDMLDRYPSEDEEEEDIEND